MLSDADELMRSLVFMLLAFAILATPIVTVILEMVFLLVTVKRPEKITRKKKSVLFMIDLITIFLAVIYNKLSNQKPHCKIYLQWGF